MALKTDFTQLPLDAMQHGLAKPIARVRLSPSQISQRLGIHFVSTQDDLDELDAALVRTQSGRQLAFVRHKDQPLPGTDIVANERSEDPTEDLIEAMRILTIGPKDLTWIHPDIDQNRVAFSHSFKNMWSIFFSTVRSIVHAPSTRGAYPERLDSTILLIEDEYLRKTLSSVLHELGHTVWQAADWKQAQQLVQQHRNVPIDRIITDEVVTGSQSLSLGLNKRGEQPRIITVPSSKRLHASTVAGLIRSDLERSR